MRQVTAAVGRGGYGRALGAGREEIKICQTSSQAALSNDARGEIHGYF